MIGGMDSKAWILVLGVVVAASVSRASWAEPVSPDGDDLPPRPPSETISSSQARLEAGLAELEAMAESAMAGGDIAITGCFEAQRDGGRQVMEVATGELLIAQDPATTPEQKAFAQEKLSATADQMEALANDARRQCGGEDDENGEPSTQTEVDEPTTTPAANPTVQMLQSVVPPVVEPNQPLAVASPTI